jgi:hypothetical protein
MSSKLVRRTIPIVFAVVSMLIIFAGYFFNVPIFKAWSSEAKAAGTIIGVIVLIVGSLRLTQMHLRITTRRGERWYMSLWLVVILALTIVLGFTVGTKSSLYSEYYSLLYLFPYACLATLHSFSILSAAYRLFRIKNLEGALFVIASVLILIRNAPVGAAIWGGFPVIGNWIMDVPNGAAQRAILITGAIASIFVGFKNILGIERGWLGVEEE